MSTVAGASGGQVLHSQAPPVGALTRWIGLGSAVAVIAIWTTTLAVTGSPVLDVFQWLIAIGLGVLLPGVVVVRAVRPVAAPLIEDAAWGAAAGCLVALLGWFLDRILPLSPGPLVVGPIVAVLGLAVPITRRRILARPAPGWGPRPTLALSLVILASIAWMVVTALHSYRVNPGAGGSVYYPDMIYQLDLVGELRHTLVPTYPPVAGTSLSYHWFLYAIDAHLLNHTGVDPFDSMVRLAPATLVPATLLLVAVVGRRASGRVWAGPLAAGLLGVVDVSEPTRWSIQDGTVGVMQYFWWLSPSQSMGWLAGVAAVGCLFALVRRSPEDRAVPLFLLLPFLVLAAGSKSSDLPVIIAGVGFATAVQAVRRDWPAARRCGAALGFGLVVFAVASKTIYGGSSYGVRAQLWGAMYPRAAVMFPGEIVRRGDLYLSAPSVPLLALVTTSALFVLPLLPRLLGLLFVVRLRAADPIGWICLGTAAAGLLVPFIVRHPGGSEQYFMLSAYPIGVIGSACGLVAAYERVSAALANSRWQARLPGAAAAVAAAGALAAAAVAYAQPNLDPVSRWVRTHPGDPKVTGLSLGELVLRWASPTAELLLVLSVLAVGVTLLVRRARAKPSKPLRPSTPSWRLTGALTLVTMLLGAGVFGATLRFGGTDAPAPYRADAVRAPATSNEALSRPSVITRDEIEAGRWVDAHAGPDDILATNLYCLSRPAHVLAGCDARNFVASALTQRRTMVGGWAYADRIVADAWTLTVPYRNAPFWAPDVLLREQNAILHPTANRLNILYRDDGVRWLFVDLRDDKVDARALDRIASRRFTGPTTAVWELRANG